MDEYAIIGAGGIGSHFCRILSQLLRPENKQLGEDVNAESFVVYDFDVVEPKNTRWQDYTMEEIGTPKAMLMTLRYGFHSRVKRFDMSNLGQHDVYLIAADNARVRRQVFDHVAQAPDKAFVDMRAEGDVYGVFTHTCPHATLLASLGADADSAVGFSCQRQADQESNRIQLGNQAVAVMGMDIFLRHYRKLPYPASLVRPII